MTGLFVDVAAAAVRVGDDWLGAGDGWLEEKIGKHVAQALAPWKKEWEIIRAFYATALKWFIRAVLCVPIFLLVTFNLYIVFSIGYCIYYPEMIIVVPLSGIKAVPLYVHYALKRIANYIWGEIVGV